MMGGLLGGGAQGGQGVDWRLLTNLHGAVVTPNGVTPATSSFTHDATTGLFDATLENTTNESDGYNDQDRIRVPLTSLFGSWDQARDGLAVYVETTQDVLWPNRPVISAGLVSGAAPGTALGTAFGVVGVGAGGQLFGIGQSSEQAGITVAFTGARPLFYAAFDTLGQGRPTGRCAVKGATWTSALAYQGDAPAASQPFYLHIGVGKNTGTTNASGETLQFRVYYAKYPLPPVPT